jgi:hypothetical protein
VLEFDGGFLVYAVDVVVFAFDRGFAVRAGAAGFGIVIVGECLL